MILGMTQYNDNIMYIYLFPVGLLAVFTFVFRTVRLSSSG